MSKAHRFIRLSVDKLNQNLYVNAMTNSLKLTTPSDREVVMTRIFDAPRALVFDAYTKPELLKRWLFGPPGWVMTVCKVDLQVGGAYRYEWRGPNGEIMGMGGVHREVVCPERIVSTQLFDEDWTGGEAVGTLVLTERDGKTLLKNTVLYSSREARDAVLKTPMEHGVAMGYDRLEKIFAAQAKGPRVRQPGEFCWINMLTPLPDEACEFFGKLLDWKFFEMPGMGYGMKVGGRDIGGLFDLHGANTPPGLPPDIGVMVKVESVDAIGERIKSLGGSSESALDILDAGRMAVCHDPNGAKFDLWEPKKMLGTDVDSSLHGAPSWFETLTDDIDRAAVFYSALFGWTTEEFSSPGMNYTNFKLEGAPIAGMLQLTPQMAGIKPHWGTYFTVTDADDTARLAVELGGKLCVPVRDIPGIGRFCGITSPQRVMFYAIQYI